MSDNKIYTALSNTKRNLSHKVSRKLLILSETKNKTKLEIKLETMLEQLF